MESLIAKTRRETSERLGRDARLLALSVLFGLGLGGFLHRLLVVLFDQWDRLAVIPGASGASTRQDLLGLGPWIAIGLAAVLFAISGGTRARTWSWRRFAGLSIAMAGAVVLAVGELEVHVFRTLEQGWRPHDLFWDVVFHIPGEAIALAGWVMLPVVKQSAERALLRAGS